MMESGERITTLTSYVGTTEMFYADKLITFVLGVRFGTNKGRSSRLFGSKIGEKKVETHDGCVFGYASGRAGSLIDQLQVVWQNQGIPVPLDLITRAFLFLCRNGESQRGESFHSIVFRFA